jgi:hypothetical protein
VTHFNALVTSCVVQVKEDSTTTTPTRCRFLHRPPTDTPRSLSASKKTDFLRQVSREKTETMKSFTFTQSAIAAKSIDEFNSDGSFIENLKSLLIYLALLIYVANTLNILSLFDKLSKYTRQQPLASVQDKPIHRRRSVLESTQEKKLGLVMPHHKQLAWSPIEVDNKVLMTKFVEPLRANYAEPLRANYADIISDLRLQIELLRRPIATCEMINTGCQTDSDAVLSECDTASVKSEGTSDLNIQEYSPKSFVVIGNTKEHKDKLKSLGGKWNKGLTNKESGKRFCGWIFSNNKMKLVEEYIFQDEKKPKTGYAYFCSHNRKGVKTDNPEMKAQDITRELARLWNELTKEEQKAWSDSAAEL